MGLIGYNKKKARYPGIALMELGSADGCGRVGVTEIDLDRRRKRRLE